MSDLLDAIDDDLGDTGLMNQLLPAMNEIGRPPEYWSRLTESVQEAVDRLLTR